MTKLTDSTEQIRTGNCAELKGTGKKALRTLLCFGVFIGVISLIGHRVSYYVSGSNVFDFSLLFRKLWLLNSCFMFKFSLYTCSLKLIHWLQLLSLNATPTYKHRHWSILFS